MEAMMEFLSMGGYAAYVWPPYIAAALIMIALALSSLHNLRERQKRLRSLEPTSRLLRKGRSTAAHTKPR